MPPAFLILSEVKARLYEPAGVEVCISITNPQAPSPLLSRRFAAVLRLAFTDIARPSPHAFDRLFSDDDARQVIAFVQRWPTAERIVVHCMAGQSRSPGIALGLCELHGWDTGDLEQRYPLWNTWVRAELLRIGRASEGPAAG